jgi:hypothetical protein
LLHPTAKAAMERRVMTNVLFFIMVISLRVWFAVAPANLANWAKLRCRVVFRYGV